MPTRAIIENIATLAATTAIVLGLYAMGAGYLSVVGFICLLNLNGPKEKSSP